MVAGITANPLAQAFGGARFAAQVYRLEGRIAKGILASFANAMGAGPFAQAMLPNLFQFQGSRGGQPADHAQWTATVGSGGQGSIDLGDGYTLGLNENNSEITIRNASTGETTQIWGDPHVTVDGQHAFDFWGTTTFQLENGTKITIDTEPFAGNPDMYVASGITITKGANAIEVKGISQNMLGDLSITQSRDGRAIDAQTRDGFVLNENRQGSGWRSEWSGKIATQADLDATKPGHAYQPGSEMPSLGEISRFLTGFLLLGAIGGLTVGPGPARSNRH